MTEREIRSCGWCHKSFSAASYGPLPIYCSAAHRQRAYEARRDAGATQLHGPLADTALSVAGVDDDPDVEALRQWVELCLEAARLGQAMARFDNAKDAFVAHQRARGAVNDRGQALMCP